MYYHTQIQGLTLSFVSFHSSIFACVAKVNTYGNKLILNNLNLSVLTRSKMNTNQAPNASRFSFWQVNLRRQSATLAGKCLHQRSHVIKNYAESFSCILMSFKGTLLLSSAVSLSGFHKHTQFTKCFQMLVNSEIYIALYGKAHGHRRRLCGAFECLL